MKINIENYENMTPEEKLAALEAYDPEKNGFVSKAIFDKTASELADKKKQLKDKMTEDEIKATEEAEKRAALEARVKELEARELVNTYTNSYLAMGYDEKTAKATAEALAKGDMKTVFANQKARIDGLNKDLETEKLKNTPAPAGGGQGNSVTTLADLRKMTPQERFEFSQKYPEEYKTLYGGN